MTHCWFVTGYDFYLRLFFHCYFRVALYSRVFSSRKPQISSKTSRTRWMSCPSSSSFLHNCNISVIWKSSKGNHLHDFGAITNWHSGWSLQIFSKLQELLCEYNFKEMSNTTRIAFVASVPERSEWNSGHAKEFFLLGQREKWGESKKVEGGVLSPSGDPNFVRLVRERLLRRLRLVGYP